MALGNKKLLITGAARRVGRSLALAAAEAGWDVVIHYWTSAVEAESLSAEIIALGRIASLLQADLNDPSQVEELISRASENRPLTALVNNAAIFEPLTWETTTLQDWNRNLMVNLTAPFLLCQSFARLLPEGETGRIINILDWRALRPGRDHLPYTISKAGLAALTSALAVSLAPRISVNGLALGAILPPEDGAIPPGILKRIPAGRWAGLDEVTQALIFLLEGPAYITGEIIHLDGGRHLV
jgi:NAD(P)-dependent dehydrogenase (short-subunit alcohol dehydrogenase family)